MRSISRRDISETADHANANANPHGIPSSRSYQFFREILLPLSPCAYFASPLSPSIFLGSESVAAIFLRARMTIIETVSTIERVSDPLSVAAHPASALHIYQLENGFMRIVSSYVLPIDTYVFHYSTSQAGKEFRPTGRNIPSIARPYSSSRCDPPVLLRDELFDIEANRASKRGWRGRMTSMPLSFHRVRV